jgi:PAS domain S-box-containing protein
MHKQPPNAVVHHLAQVVESCDDAIVTKDLSGIIRTWNRAAERMFGFTAQEAVGRSIRIIVPDDRQSEEDTILATVRDGRAVTHFETMRQRKDESLVPISLTVSPICDERGAVIGASRIARDLTERKEAEAAIRRLAGVVRSSDDAIVTKTLQGVITSWNPGAERIFGYTEAEAIGQSIRMLIPEALQGEEDVVLAKVRAGEMIDHYETTRRRKDGRLISISLTVSPLRDEAGNIIGASKIARDITEQVRLRRLADQHAANTEKLGEVAQLVASTLDREAIVQKVTDAARELTGAEFGAFLANVRDVSSPSGAFMLYALSGAPKEAFANFPHPRATTMLGLTFRGEGVVRVDDVTQDVRYAQNSPFFGTPPGHPPVRSYLAVPVKRASGDVLGGLFFGHSQRAVFTEEHERLAVNIASWAAVALENAGLYVEAQQANRMKDEFLAVLSHELRTPLNAILGYARLLRGGILTGDKAAQGFETLERNAASLAQIIEDVLDVSRIVSGKLRLDVQPVELPLIIENAVATVRPAADAKGVRIQTTLDPRVGPVSGDPNRLQQIAWNLLSNAVKFTPRGGRVQVRLERVNSHVELVVSDTGLGIAPDFLPHVFERFRQADPIATRKAGGLGLGLALVRHIVEMHGGTVDASSAGEGQGATFRVRFPLMIVHPERAVSRREHPRTERLSALTELGDLSGVRVVAIDDEDDAIKLLRVVLDAAGAQVTTFSSPLAALNEIEQLKPDVLLVDLGMPGMDGCEFISRVRSSPNRDVRHLPAAALTAFARAEDRTKALRSGFEMHLAKPVDPGELVAAITTLVRRAQSRR